MYSDCAEIGPKHFCTKLFSGRILKLLYRTILGQYFILYRPGSGRSFNFYTGTGQYLFCMAVVRDKLLIFRPDRDGLKFFLWVGGEKAQALKFRPMHFSTIDCIVQEPPFKMLFLLHFFLYIFYKNHTDF